MQDTACRCLAGKGQVQVAIVVKVTPGHIADSRTRKVCANVRESAGTVVVIDACNQIVGEVEPAHHEVRVGIIVVVAPGQAACQQTGYRGTVIQNEPALSVIRIEEEGRVALVVDLAHSSQVQVAVIVVVCPGKVAVVHPGEGLSGISGECAILVEVDPGHAVARNVALQSQVQISVVVDIGQCRAAAGQLGQRIQAG